MSGKLEKQARLRDLLNKEIPSAKKSAAGAQRRISELEAEAKKLERELSAYAEDVRVSDHAVLRYIERVLGFDVGKIRKDILTPEREGFIRAGASKININGVVFVVKDKTIVTTI